MFTCLISGFSFANALFIKPSEDASFNIGLTVPQIKYYVKAKIGGVSKDLEMTPDPENDGQLNKELPERTIKSPAAKDASHQMAQTTNTSLHSQGQMNQQMPQDTNSTSRLSDQGRSQKNQEKNPVTFPYFLAFWAVQMLWQRITSRNSQHIQDQR